MSYFTLAIFVFLVGIGAADEANAAKEREKPRAWQDLETQVAKEDNATSRLSEHLDGPVSRAFVRKQSVSELLFDDYSISRDVRIRLADELDLWLKISRQLAREALSYPFAPDRDEKECATWMSVFETIYKEGDVISKELRTSQMKDVAFMGLIGRITNIHVWDGGQLGAAMQACYMHKGVGVIVTASVKERRKKYEAESHAN